MRRRDSWKLKTVGLIVALLATSGCGDSQLELAPVAGTVTIDGRPFVNGKVMFAPIAAGEQRLAGRTAISRVDEQGRYQLGTYEPGDGAVVGDHWVTLISLPPQHDADEFSPATLAKAAAAHPPRAFDRLGAPDKVTVVAGRDNQIDIALSLADVKRLGRVED